MEKSMTALMCLFARAYHNNNSKLKIYKDQLSTKLITPAEYVSISNNLKIGINYFNPNFKGTSEEALDYIVNNQIAPTILGRSQYTKKMLSNAIKLGCKQYLIFASGYDTSGYDLNINVFELDKENMIEDKKERIGELNINHNVNYITCDFTRPWIANLLNSKYDKEKLSFSSLLGLSYYLTKNEFKRMLATISENISYGSSIVFDYQTYNESDETTKNEELATGANEKMKAKYTLNELTKMLEEFDLLIYENLDECCIDNDLFCSYNVLNPKQRITAPTGINYCLCVKKNS